MNRTRWAHVGTARTRYSTVEWLLVLVLLLLAVTAFVALVFWTTVFVPLLDSWAQTTAPPLE
ncbi:MAG TPA: hypothetical protein VGW38_18445 [Chloroflexota bacterium]|nr:hypothetical protein [Chloroflexota bacterium]